MIRAIDRLVLRPFVALWLKFARDSWFRLPVANDSPHVHAPGTHPDRILVTGDGASAGRGVLTHDLGLPGYLARSLTALTGRATDVDIVVASDMTAAKCSTAIAAVNLTRFDAVMLSVGTVEALAFTRPDRWARDLDDLLDQVERGAPESAIVFVLSVPYFAPHRLFPGVLARACDRQVTLLNRVTREKVASRPRARYVIVGETESLESSGAHTYELWAASVAPHIAAELPAGSSVDDREQVVVEAERQAALESLRILDLDLGSDPVLEDLTQKARQIFGTAFAAITLIDSHRQMIASSSGLPTHDMARRESFCDVTIRRDAHLTVEDALLDNRYQNLRIVNSGPRVRFYAGYPIESPDGHRLGAMCVLDPEPRRFSDEDATLLRLLAQETQKRLWQLGATASATGNDVSPEIADEPSPLRVRFQQPDAG